MACRVASHCASLIRSSATVLASLDFRGFRGIMTILADRCVRRLLIPALARRQACRPAVANRAHETVKAPGTDGTSRPASTFSAFERSPITMRIGLGSV